MDMLKKLNEAQKEAACSIEGPILIVAGAGTGKTKVITHRIARIISQKISPQKILAVTFTNKAALEMKERVDLLAGSIFPQKESPTIETFHSLSADILRKHGNRIGIQSNFSILNEIERQEMIKLIIKGLNLNLKQFPVGIIQNIISRKKSLLGSNPMRLPEKEFQDDAIEKIQNKYEECLKRKNALDFDDLVLKTAILLKEDANILKIYQDKWRYIHIDEYQDTDNAQFNIIRMLSSAKNNICAVGDEDQSIYGFRGADFTNILNFEKNWPNAKIITLERNYRSTKKILDAANKIIVKNMLRRQKNLFTDRKEGEKISAFEAENEKEEANFISREIKNILKNCPPNSPVAILCRLRSQFPAIEKSLIENGLEFKTLANQDSDSGKKSPIWLMTVHTAKGLEFKHVFVPGLEKGLFPYSNSNSEEERRLFYVALTRAQEKIYLSWCRFRTVFGAKQINQPSQFLADIPPELIE